MQLTNYQSTAIQYIESYAKGRREVAVDIIEEVRKMCNIPVADLNKAFSEVKNKARVAIHFHPDRLKSNGQSIIEALLEEGAYKNQFETKLSNGKLSPYLGGPRDIWENQMFGGAFSLDESLPSYRPKYGALDLMHHPDGPAPRFGSCYFVLNQSLSHRSTFTYMDSHRAPAEKGTLSIFEDIMAGLLLECFERNYALGEKEITPAQVIDHLSSDLGKSYNDPSLKSPARNLNHYIEAQVHGPIDLESDVEILVADPSFSANRIGGFLRKLCEKFDIQLYWHSGFTMPASEVPLDFRGASMPSLAERISKNGWIDASTIGQASGELCMNPGQWSDRGSVEECLQELKLLWHVLVQYGIPVKNNCTDLAALSLHPKNH